MLAIRYKSSFSVKKFIFIVVIIAILSAGAYVAMLFFSPAIAHRFYIKPIAVSSLAAPTHDDNRLIIPALGIDISYTTGTASLEQNAQWSNSTQGNPEDGGTMLLAAHRLSVQTTPQQTVVHSPFYSLDTLTKGDKLIVNYKGTRYGYEISSVRSGKVSDTQIPTESSPTQLVLYTFDSENDATRVVVCAKPLGKVAI